MHIAAMFILKNPETWKNPTRPSTLELSKLQRTSLDEILYNKNKNTSYTTLRYPLHITWEGGGRI